MKATDRGITVHDSEIAFLRPASADRFLGANTLEHTTRVLALPNVLTARAGHGVGRMPLC